MADDLPAGTLSAAGGPGVERPRGARSVWPRLRPLAAYGAVLALTLVLLALVAPPGWWDLRTPFNYRGDSILNLMFTKTLVENGWGWRNPSLGAPGELELYEFPVIDTLPGLILKALTVFTHDPALLNNLFFLLTFPLTSLAAFFVCRQIGFLTGPSALGALLYAFAPYHFFRGEAHLYLSAYFVVPPAVLAAWWVAEGRLFAPRGPGWPGRLPLAGGICLLVSLSGVYYPFFAGILLATASLAALCVRRDWRHFATGGLLTALVAGGMLACLLPALIDRHRHPGQPTTVRWPEESEVYGLKIVEILLPIDGHRIPWLATDKARYDLHAPLVNENVSAATGAVGAAGFLLLIGWLLFRPARRALAPPGRAPAGAGHPPDSGFLDTLSVFNAAAVFFGTVGGFGTVFALLVTPEFRSVNRISVFIDFFALLAVAFCLDALARRRRHSRWARGAGWTALAALLVLGVLDQTRPANSEDDRAARRAYEADRHFFRQAAAGMPPGGMIFQLPYLSFPEALPAEALESYAPFRGYLHTSGLRWSFGAMRDSPADQWQQGVAGLPPESAVRQLALSGFAGVQVQRGGYADRGAALAAGLGGLLGPPAAAGPGDLFFSLNQYTAALRAGMTPEQWRQAANLARHRTWVRFGAGFNLPAAGPGTVSRWTRREGELTLTNPAGQTRQVALRMLASTARTVPLPLAMTFGHDRRTWTITRQNQPLAALLDLPPGETVVHFSCPAQGRPTAPAWLMTDFQIEQDPAASPPRTETGPATPAVPAAPPAA